MRRLIAVLVLLLMVSSVAWAYNVWGHFKTNGGHTVHIKLKPNGHIFVHVFGKGLDDVFDGVWDRPGHVFHYQQRDGFTQCVVKSDNLIEVHLPGGRVGEWVRLDWN